MDYPHFLFYLLKSRYDKKSTNNKNFIRLIRQLATKATIGIHASYASSFSDSELEQRNQNLQQHLDNPFLPTVSITFAYVFPKVTIIY